MKQPYMTPCPFWAASLAATHPDDLTLFERVALKNHMASCPACTAVRAEYEAMGREISQLRSVEPQPELPPGLLKLWNGQESKAAKTSTVSSVSDEEQVEIDDAAPVPQSMPSLPPKRQPRRHKRRKGVLIQTIAAVLVVAVLLGASLAVFASHHTKTGLSSPTRSWKIMPSPSPGTTGNALNAAAAISANDIWAVGGTSSTGYTSQPITQLIGSDILIEHWNGKQWQVVPAPEPSLIHPSYHALNSLNAIAAFSSNDVWAVGGSYQYGQIQVIKTPVYTIDDHGQSVGFIDRWDGSKWSMMTLPQALVSHAFSTIAAISKNDVWIAGDIIAHWNGANWSIVPGPILEAKTNIYFNALSAISSSDIWAVGGYSTGSTQHAFIVHWDGISWKIAQSLDTNFFSGIAALSAQNIWAVGGSRGRSSGDGGQPFIEHWDGVQWSVIHSPGVAHTRSNTFSAIVALSANDIWAVGLATVGYPDLGPAFTEHWDGKQWKIVYGANLGLNDNHYLFGVIRLPGTNNILAVGSYNDYRTLVELYS